MIYRGCKIISINELQAYGFEFKDLSTILCGDGPYITMEFDSEIGWFPWCGTNRFKTKWDAVEAIKVRG